VLLVAVNHVTGSAPSPGKVGAMIGISCGGR